MAELMITEYTDPGCPFAWSAEHIRCRLQWLYVDQLEWTVRIVGMAEDGSAYEDKGFTADRMSESFRRLPRLTTCRWTRARPRMAGTIPAWAVAVRRHQPEQERATPRAAGAALSGHLPRARDAQRRRAAGRIEPADLQNGWPSRRPSGAVT
jgi:hypothetical protein